MKQFDENPGIIVGSSCYLSRPRLSDVPALMRYLNERDVSRQTVLIPFPYQRIDGEQFIHAVDHRRKLAGRQMDWAIRTFNHELIGIICLHGRYRDDPGRDEIGFWLGKPFWGRGIMTDMVGTFTEFLFSAYHLRRIEMSIFPDNGASIRVAEKCGFIRTGDMEKVDQNGTVRPSFIYVRVTDQENAGGEP